MSLIKLSLSFLFGLLIFSSANSDQLIVTDGDTIRIGDERIRFSGIDAPEINQNCIYQDLTFNCGEFSKKLLLEKISDQEIDANFDLLVKVLNFPKHIKEYTEERSPHSLVHFVKELAASFHSFYETSPVICDDEAVSNARLLITETTKLVIEKSFRLLNVKPLEKM